MIILFTDSDVSVSCRCFDGRYFDCSIPWGGLMSWFQKCLLVSPSICCDMVWTWVFTSKSLLDQSQCLLRPVLCGWVFTTLSPTGMLVCVHLDTRHVRTPHPQYVFVFILRLEMVLLIQQTPLQYMCISHLNWMRHYIKLHMISTVNLSLNTAYN